MPSSERRVHGEPFWPGLFAEALASVNTGCLICGVGAAGLPARRSRPSTPAAPAEEKEVKTKRNLRSVMLTRGFGRFD